MKIQSSFLPRFSIVLMLTFSGLSVKAERIVFDMSVLGIKIGQMVLTHTVVNDSIERYTIKSVGKTDFLWMKREEVRTFKVEYRQGKLFSSDFEYFENGGQKEWSTIRFDGEKYVVKSNEGNRELKHPLYYSHIKLYFDPNWKTERLFCEEDCSYATLKRNPHTLNMVSHDGSKSTYYIKNGRVESIDFHLAVATVKLTRVN